MTKHKNFELSYVLSLFKAGLSASQIANKLNISKSNLSYYTRKLKDLSILRNMGKGVWEVSGDVKTVQNILPTRYPSTKKILNYHKQKKEIRGHAFIWKVKFTKDYNWENLLRKSNLKYKIQSNGKVKRIFFNDRKIWLNKNGELTIYEPFDYFGRNAYESKSLAVYNMDRTLKLLIKKLKTTFYAYKFTTSRVHYSLIKNALAKQINDKKQKLAIKTETGTEWLWIDDSKGLNEFEVGNIKGSEDISRDSQNWWNSHRKTNFKITPEFILNTMNGIQQNQLIFDKNMSSHLNVLKDLKDTIKELRQEVKELRKQKHI